MWERIVVVRNAEALPPLVERPTGHDGQGFKALLLDDSGRAASFVRCGWRNDSEFRRESRLLRRLVDDGRCRPSLPEMAFGKSDNLRVLVSRYAGPTTMLHRMRNYGPKRWIDAASEVLDVCASTMTIVAEVGGPLVDNGSYSDIPSAAESRLQVLDAEPGLGLDLDALRTAIGLLADLEPVLQHGDMWPANVLWNGGAWQLLDFAECGHSWCPLYDVFHMLSTGPDASLEHPWFALGSMRSDSWGKSRIPLLQSWQERLGLSQAQTGAALVYYLVHLLAYRLRPGISRTYSEPILTDLRRISKSLLAGRRVEDLLPRS